MPAIGRNTRTSKLETLTNEEIQKKWDALLPNFIRYTSLAAIVSIGVYLTNHFGHLSQRATDIVVVAFEISSIFTVCFLFLTLAALYFRSNAWIKK
ncbi:MAG TPA: hypothetical protein VM008_04470 [Phycisphaerae bacterium]|nr:hypothetical protein [Phycisphaerae bacterium]